MKSVLFVCTGNQCRSPMAAALLQSRLDRIGAPGFEVGSAGFVSEGRAVPPEVIAVMSPLGIDLSAHRSRLVHESLLGAADLIVVMTRQHLMDVVVVRPDIWPRAFTLAEILRRAEPVGGRLPGEGLASWTDRVHAGRARAEILGLPSTDDVPDPMGGTVHDYERVRDLLGQQVGRLATLLVPA